MLCSHVPVYCLHPGIGRSPPGILSSPHRRDGLPLPMYLQLDSAEDQSGDREMVQPKFWDTEGMLCAYARYLKL